MQPIFKDSSVPQPLSLKDLSLEDFIVKAINRMQAQQRSSHSEDEFNVLTTDNYHAANYMQSFLEAHPTYLPDCFYRIHTFNGVDDKRLQSIVDKINTFPAQTAHLPVQPIVLDEKEKA